ncbi:MAG: ABC transporter permease [Chloroflexi bacterium]|nr:ABC transporter permease [Chloroflexota bacterium]
MKILDITLKDMRQSFRNKGAIVFMFIIPVLVTGLFYFMFGSIAGEGEDEAFTLPQTAVILVNLDSGQLPIQSDMTSAASMGGLLRDLLQNEELSSLISLTEMDDAAAARTAVDHQKAGVAIIIPPNMTQAIMSGEETAVELYRDPTLTIGPAIVAGIVHQFIDGFSASSIGIGLIMEQLAAADVPINGDVVQEVVDRYTAAANPQQPSQLVTLQAPPGQANQGNEMTQILTLILGGMMVFFAFFTGANVLQSVLTEQENGTLQRLFTTPTPHKTIFSGKFIAALLILTVQVAVLLIFGRLVFNIQWGAPLPVVLAAIGLILISATTGLFLVSLLKDSRQAGAIFGGLLTLTGMLGLISVFTAGAPGTPAMLETISLLVPQGWAMRTFRQSMDGRALPDILLTFGVILLWSAIFFIIGQRRLQKRFA